MCEGLFESKRSSHLVLKDLPVFPIYTRPQSPHLIYILLICIRLGVSVRCMGIGPKKRVKTRSHTNLKENYKNFCNMLM